MSTNNAERHNRPDILTNHERNNIDAAISTNQNPLHTLLRRWLQCRRPDTLWLKLQLYSLLLLQMRFPMLQLYMLQQGPLGNRLLSNVDGRRLQLGPYRAGHRCGTGHWFDRRYVDSCCRGWPRYCNDMNTVSNVMTISVTE